MKFEDYLEKRELTKEYETANELLRLVIENNFMLLSLTSNDDETNGKKNNSMLKLFLGS